MPGLLPLLAALAQPVDSGFVLQAIRATTPPTIDGVVSPAEWATAARATGFRQYLPRRGEPASAETEVLVQYDSTHVYVAFLVHDPEAPTA
jgi:hypothetical protein